MSARSVCPTVLVGLQTIEISVVWGLFWRSPPVAVVGSGRIGGGQRLLHLLEEF